MNKLRLWIGNENCLISIVFWGKLITFEFWIWYFKCVYKIEHHKKTFIFDTLKINIKTDWKRMFLYKWPLYDLFWPLFCHVYLHLPQNWGSDGHFEELNKSNIWLVQNLWHKTQIFPFLFLLRFGTKTDICLFCVFCVLVFFVITFVPIKI